MDDHELKKFADLLKHSIVSVNPELDRDLWPRMQRRLDEQSVGHRWHRMRAGLLAVPWFDWALFAVLVIAVCVFPNSIPVWLYHF